MRDREDQMRVFGVLVFFAIAADASVYVGGLFHLYVHDVISVLAGGYGAALAIGHRSFMPAKRLLWIPLGLFAFLLVNMVALGALQYPGLASDMHKLFWFEHLNALRIVGELFVWTWALAHLAPDHDEAWSILDIASWGAALNVAVVGGYWLFTNAPHAATTTVDLDVMVGLPMAVVFVITRGRRRDFIRLLLFSAGGPLLYSRTAILALVFTTVFVLLTIRQWRSLFLVGAAIASGWLLTLTISIAIVGATGQSAGVSVIDRGLSIVNPDLVPYTIPSRLTIWTDAIRIFQISPIVGVGYHDYFIFSRVTEIKDASRLDSPGLFSSLIKQAHSDYLSWLTETGLLGFAAYVTFWLVTLASALRLWRSEPADRPQHTYQLAFLSSLLGVGLFGEILIPRTPEWMSSAILWWIVIGLVLIEASRREVLLRAHR